MIIRTIIGLAAGGGIGFAAGFLVRRCGGGGCPLTCNPWGAMIFGAVLGLLLALGPGTAPPPGDGRPTDARLPAGPDGARK